MVFCVSDVLLVSIVSVVEVVFGLHCEIKKEIPPSRKIVNRIIENVFWFFIRTVNLNLYVLVSHPLDHFTKRDFLPVHQNSRAVNFPCGPHQK